MAVQIFELRNEYIALCDLIKNLGIAHSGGAAKLMVAEGRVTVDGALESRKTAKIRVGMVVHILSEEIRIVAAE